MSDKFLMPGLSSLSLQAAASPRGVIDDCSEFGCSAQVASTEKVVFHGASSVVGHNVVGAASGVIIGAEIGTKIPDRKQKSRENCVVSPCARCFKDSVPISHTIGPAASFMFSEPKENTQHNKNVQRGDLKFSLSTYKDAISCDSYMNDSWDDLDIVKYYLNYQERQSKLRECDEQKPEGKLDLGTVPLFSMANLEKIRDFNNKPPNNPDNNLKKKDLDELIRCSWLHLKLPEDLFSYTTIVQLNNEFAGLCHSLIRHFDQWKAYISINRELNNRLSPIMDEINRVSSITGGRPRNRDESETQSLRTRERSTIAIHNFQDVLQNLPINMYCRVKLALVQIQVLMHACIENNIASSSYIRNAVNVNGFVQLHFKVKTMNGETQVLVVGVSRELYDPVPSVDKRPIREVITIFFKPWYNDALYYDSYLKNSWGDVVASEHNWAQKQKILQYQDKQEPKTNIYFAQLFDQIHLMAVRACNNDTAGKVQEDFDRDYFLEDKWLHLSLPKGHDFSYTALIQLNRYKNGLLHSFIRHIDQWREFISFDQKLTDRLSPIIKEINELSFVTEDTTAANETILDPKTAKNKVREARKKAEEAREKLEDVSENLPRDVSINVRVALLRIQILLYDFIESNVTSCKYMRRTVDAEDLEQLHFKVTTLKGETKVMVICVSIELSKPIKRVDKRPIRKVMTVYFKSQKDYYKHFGKATKF